MIERWTEAFWRHMPGIRRRHERIFTSLYRRNAWENPESVSGPGSTRERGAAFSADLVGLLKAVRARSLMDAPCGDFNWMSPVADSVEKYIGVDVVRDLVSANQRNHGSGRRHFMHADITRDALPSADVILCRDCLVHFSDADVLRALRNFRESRSRFLLTTSFMDRARNDPISTGGWRPLNLELMPFSLGKPLAEVDERCVHSGGIYRDKRLALWDLAAMRLPEEARGP